MTETWLPIVGWEGFYEVSDHGNVRSLDRVVECMRRGRPVVKKYKGRNLTLIHATSSGYPVVNLSGNGKRAQEFVHRLVLEAFRGTCPPGHEACHWDDDPANNRLDNLRWGTYSENEFDKVRNGKHHHARKTHCKHGHEFTPENIYVQPNGWRSCRTCHRDKQRDYQARRRAA